MADEEYYLTAQYLVQIASRAKELFAGSEPEEKRLLLNMTLQNLRLDGKIVRYDWKKPFDKIAFYASRPIWAPLMGLYPTAFPRYESKPTVSACIRLNINSFSFIGTSVEDCVMITRLVRA